MSRWLTYREFKKAGWPPGTRFVMLSPSSTLDALVQENRLRILRTNSPSPGDTFKNEAWDRRTRVWLGFSIWSLFQKFDED